MNAVERVHHYTHNIAQERPRVIPGADPPASWPSQGHIHFEVTRYSRVWTALVMRGEWQDVVVLPRVMSIVDCLPIATSNRTHN